MKTKPEIDTKVIIHKSAVVSAESAADIKGFLQRHVIATQNITMKHKRSIL